MIEHFKDDFIPPCVAHEFEKAKPLRIEDVLLDFEFTQAKQRIYNYIDNHPLILAHELTKLSESSEYYIVQSPTNFIEDCLITTVRRSINKSHEGDKWRYIAGIDPC